MEHNSTENTAIKNEQEIPDIRSIIADIEVIQSQISALQVQFQTKKSALAQAVQITNQVAAAYLEEGEMALSTTPSALPAGTDTSPASSKVAPKYRDPVSGQTWTGRGKPPAWIAGKDRDQFLITPTGVNTTENTTQDATGGAQAPIASDATSTPSTSNDAPGFDLEPTEKEQASFEGWDNGGADDIPV